MECVCMLWKRSWKKRINFWVDFEKVCEYYINMKNKLNVWEYMVKEFGMEKSEKIRDEYEENFGLNGLDYLWSLESEDEVYEVLGDYVG